MKINRIEHMCEGNGHVIIKELLDEQQLNGKCGLYAEVTLEPGCSLGFHMHYGESETYYILTGEGEYNDNGTSWRHVKAGDITFTPDGRGHGLANTGNTDMVFMALIIKDGECCYARKSAENPQAPQAVPAATSPVYRLELVQMWYDLSLWRAGLAKRLRGCGKGKSIEKYLGV